MGNFEFFENFNTLYDGELMLKISQKYGSDNEMLPYYYYDIYLGNACIGKISIRIGANYHSYYDGNIGYEIEESYQGNNYAFKACKLILQVAKAHGMNEIILACDESNIASYKTIEHLGAELLEIVIPPEDYFAFQKGMKAQRIYKLQIP